MKTVSPTYSSVYKLEMPREESSVSVLSPNHNTKLKSGIFYMGKEFQWALLHGRDSKYTFFCSKIICDITKGFGKL